MKYSGLLGVATVAAMLAMAGALSPVVGGEGQSGLQQDPSTLTLAAPGKPDMSVRSGRSSVVDIACKRCRITTQCGTGYGCKNSKGKCVVENPPECKY